MDAEGNTSGQLQKKKRYKEGQQPEPIPAFSLKSKMAAHNRQARHRSKTRKAASEAWTNQKPKRRNSAKPHLC